MAREAKLLNLNVPVHGLPYWTTVTLCLSRIDRDERFEFEFITGPHSRKTFHGVLWEAYPHPDNPAIPQRTGKQFDAVDVYTKFDQWLAQFGGRPVFVSDNPAFDWQWVNHGFHHTLGRNPFGFSARRIGDFAAGLRGDFYAKQDWKQLRKTMHDHNPVNDAMGNAEAFEQLLNSKR